MTDPTLPGRGAEEVASRASRRAQALRREQELRDQTDAAAQAQLERALQQQRSWSQGAEGERLVAHTLGALERYGWTLLHDVRQPDRQLANIDHVAIGPGGVVVIDAKNWTGSVTTEGGVLRQNGYARTKETDAVGLQAASVAALLRPEHRTAARGALTTVAHDIEPVQIGPITVVGRAQLGPWLLTLPPRLTPFDVAAVASVLDRELVQPRDARAPRAHGRKRRPTTTPAPHPGKQPTQSRGRALGVGLLKLGLAVIGVACLVTYGPAIAGWIGDVIAGVIASSTSTP